MSKEIKKDKTIDNVKIDFFDVKKQESILNHTNKIDKKLLEKEVIKIVSCKSYKSAEITLMVK
ncbi:hypothetical protein EMELA_v1c03640 [Mesoplasma melaleucae]|uniref:Uncharacterized protein n=1 Tax=Mesoplasma melaleucae TaxID=81459 RepID=A0A2K8NWK3_9MOLU|nr:hypothetical protein [Mesoplasma melaleucae]ATZ17926.1 hypothetical protein EMELA_v1c03640 [Mesoplasma melaleucae]